MPRRAGSSACPKARRSIAAAAATVCDGNGVKGRIGIYEVMRMTPSLRAMVGRGARAEEIHAAALEQGMIDLKGYAALLLLDGQTTRRRSDQRRQYRRMSR